MKTIGSYLAKAGLKTAIGRWSWGIAGTVILALSASLLQSCARITEARTAQKTSADKLAEKTLAYTLQAKHVRELESKIEQFKCSAGWTVTQFPDGRIEKRCEGIMTGEISTTRSTDSASTPTFAPSGSCPPEFYPLGIAGDITVSPSAFAWNAGPTYEWATGWSGKAAIGQINGGWAGTLGVQARFPKKSKTTSGGN
jgi:hypothetical protein